MKALFIGGTGTISTAITRRLSTLPHWEVYLLNRGNRNSMLPNHIKTITADIDDEETVKKAIKDLDFDCVCDFIVMRPEQIERDYRLFKGKTRQYMFISSASAYQKPVGNYLITESTPLANPFWEYSRQKQACEELLMRLYREEHFPVTIIRPSHTYDERKVPLAVKGHKGSFQVLKRMKEGKPVIIQGDGTGLWTMTHNSDFAIAFTGLMANQHAIGEAFHITSDETLTWNQIYQSIANALGVPLKPYYVASEFLAAVDHYDLRGSLLGDKSNSVVFDNTKVKRLVPEFIATKRFDIGIRETIQYIFSHPECQIEDPEFDNWCDKIIAAQEQAKQNVLSK